MKLFWWPARLEEAHTLPLTWMIMGRLILTLGKIIASFPGAETAGQTPFSPFDTCTAPLNLHEHYPEELYVRLQISSSLSCTCFQHVRTRLIRTISFCVLHVWKGNSGNWFFAHEQPALVLQTCKKKVAGLSAFIYLYLYILRAPVWKWSVLDQIDFSDWEQDYISYSLLHWVRFEEEHWSGHALLFCFSLPFRSCRVITVCKFANLVCNLYLTSFDSAAGLFRFCRQWLKAAK